MGRWVGELRRLTGSLQAEVQDVVDEVMRPVNEASTVATESFTSTFASPEVSGVVEAEGATSAASPSTAASDPASGGDAPADPSLN